MTSPPTFDLNRLRDIGWTHWDPIGLRAVRDDCDDEYDRYLTHIASHLWDGKNPVAAANYLVLVEAEHMGLGPHPSAMPRAQATISAIADYIVDLRC